MRYLGSLTIAVCVYLSAIPVSAQQKINLRFGSADIGAATYVYAAGMAELVQPKLPAGSSIAVLPRAGGVGNIKAVQAGEMELGLTFSVTSAEACGGFGSTFKQKHDKVRAVMGGLDNFYFATFVTKKSGVTSWDDIIRAKGSFHLLTTKPGGTGEAAVREVIDLMGSSKDAIKRKGGVVEATERSSAAETIRDGQADGWAHIVPPGHPGATQIVAINEMMVLPLPEKIIDGMSKKGWSRAALPANSFKGQSQAVSTVKTSSNIVTRESVPEEVIYAFTKTIMENAAKLPKIHAALGAFNPKNAAEPALNGNCPLHPGAARYYKEVGLIN